MARLPRLSLPGVPHHIIQRGNNRQPVFLDDLDRRTWLAALGEVSVEHGVEVHAYVLMPNHFHVLATPREPGAVSRMMQSLGRRYVAWFNHRHGRTGTLWEGRFRATIIDSERYFSVCMRYVELNPVRAGIVARAEEHPWSSARHHLGHWVDPLVTDHRLFWQLGNTPFDRQLAWRQLLEEAVAPAETAQVTHATLHGWALGSEGFAREAQSRTDRRVSAKPRGRPKTVSEASLEDSETDSVPI
jgi:putative transposase